MKSIYICILAIGHAINLAIAFRKGVHWPVMVISVIIGVGFSIPFYCAAFHGSIQTKQDGEIRRLDNPIRFWVYFAFITLGFFGSLCIPWLLRAGTPH